VIATDNKHPHIVVIAGPNGAGKSTTAPSLLKGTLQVTEFVNADLIAQGLSAFQPEMTAFSAGRIMLERLRYLAWFFYDNSGAEPRLIAHGGQSGKLVVIDDIIWHNIERQYGR
jgi:predicted ABC-type ATPase